MSCPIKVDSNTIKLTVHTSCYCILELLCDKGLLKSNSQKGYKKSIISTEFMSFKSHFYIDGFFLNFVYLVLACFNE